MTISPQDIVKLMLTVDKNTDALRLAADAMRQSVELQAELNKLVRELLNRA